MHQRPQSIHAKSKTSSMNNHLSNNRRQKKSLRRTWSHRLPSFATDTVKMVVATMQLTNTTTNLNKEYINNIPEHEQYDDNDDGDDDNIFNIGQQVQAHIPDIVLNNLNDLIDRQGNISIPNEHKYDNTTLLFLDVSGFTSLTEQYSNDAHLGIDQLTRTLNSYFDKLVYEILTHDGDIYKFAGDAILALWTNETTGSQQALKCALHLQQKCGAYETDVGVILRLKVALAYGPVCAIFVGTDEFKHYLLTGNCVKDVNICEQLCEPGDIILTKAVYDKLKEVSFNCTFVSVSDDIDPKHEHIAVKYSQSKKTLDEDSDLEEHISNSAVINDRMDISNQEITYDNNNNNKQSSENDLSNNELNLKIDSLMKSFLLHCVHQRIERKQSLDYLSELRRVTISFINLNISSEQTINDNLHENIHKIFVQIYKLTKMMGGVLTKALLFDKGFSFLCVFGLPGYKQGDDTANALKSAQMIHSTIRDQYQFVENCSIGVTTGLTYCGVVGHTARCEYTVIGRKVNMAARLMCNYVNIVSCDQETYYNSRLNSRYFQKLPIKTLKGMNDVGLIWQYDDHPELPQMIEQNRAPNFQINEIKQECYPLLGRRVELMIVAAQIMLLDEPVNSSNRRRDLAAIIFEGEDKIGRSRLLQFIANSLENSTNVHNISTFSHYDDTYIPNDSTINTNNTILPVYDTGARPRSSLGNYSNDCSIIKKPSTQVINYHCQFEQRFNEFGLLRSLLRQLLQFHNDDKSQHEREQHLLRLFDISKANDLYLRRNLFVLNDLLDVRFRCSHIETENTNDNNLVKTYEVNLNELLLHILNKLIEPQNNIGELYTPSSTTGNTMNTSHPPYVQSHPSICSATSITCSTISTISKIIFIIDDIHFADKSSLKHLLTLGSHSRCLLILSMKPPRNNHNDGSISTILQSISTDSRVYLRRLPGLELRYLATLACQMLSVHRIPAKLVKVFNESCNGIPGFCEQILFDLLSKDKIYIVEDNNNSYDDDPSLIEGDADKLLLNNPIRIGLFKTFFSRRKQQITNEQRQNERAFSRICLLRNPTENDFNADCQQNFQNYIMCRIDRLSEGESLLVKIAAVVGNTFSRMFLWHLVDPNSKQLININSCILEMMQRTIIECAFSKQQITKTRSIKCYCLQNPGGFPSQCRLMAFTHSTIREGIYNSLTDGLKRLLTRNAIDYLENQCTIVCITCATNKNDSPFLVDEQDGLAKIIKNSQQHAFVDIVKIAALKEIDNTIKKLSNISSSPKYSHTKRTSYGIPEVYTESNENETTNQTRSSNNDEDKRRNSVDSNNTESLHPKETVSRFYSVEHDDVTNEKKTHLKTPRLSRHNSHDPTLTLISVYSPNMSSTIQFNVRRSSSSSSVRKPSQFFSLFKVPKQRSISKSLSNTQLLQTVDGVVLDDNTNQTKTNLTIEIPKTTEQNKNNRFISFFQYLFCQCVPMGSNATVTPAINNNQTKNNNNCLNQISATNTSTQVDNHPKENVVANKRSSNWMKVRRAVLPAHGKSLRTIPNEDELLERSIFSLEAMEQITNDINCLNKQVHLIRTFKTLYDQSLTFNVFQSYVQHNNLIQYVYELKQNEEENPDLNKFVNEFNSYNDLRTCECIDYVMTIYIKLVEYHTNLYDIYEKMVDDKRDIRSKQFDRIMYYRIEICELLLRCNCLQRLLVEIETAKKFIENFQNDTKDQQNFIYEYQFLITKYTYDLFQAIVLQRTRAIHDSKQLCEHNLKELNQAYENKIWENLISSTESSDLSSANDKRKQFRHSKSDLSKDSSLEFNCNSQSSTTPNSDQFCLFDGKYRLEYLLCQYNLLQFDLSRQQSIDSINTLIELQYYTFPLSFSLPCTITLVEYFYCQNNYNQCLTLINKIIHFWWSYTSPREKLEFAKLKCLSLIIELQQGSLNSAILSGYFAKRILTGYHENIFLIQSCIHLTLALVGEMCISNVELILQHLEYLSEQTINCYTKLWYYILVIDISIELGYELLPITNDLLENITKYRKKLLPGSNERSILLVYSDCTLAQVYARLGLLNLSKIHFHQALYQIKYDQMHLSNTDFRFKRSLLKLVEIQLLHWYHRKEHEENEMQNYFLLNYLNEFKNDEFTSWNKSRFFIYQAYYDRLINDYNRHKNFSIDNDFNWQTSLCEAEKDAIKLDREWIKCLRHAWIRPVSEQISLQGKCFASAEQHRESKTLIKPNNRYFIRSSISHMKILLNNDMKIKNEDADDHEQSITIDSYFRQKFVDLRSITNKNNASQFPLYVLPVRV